jgi:hypothetical protein
LENWYYAFSGLRVVSELHLPEWAVFEEKCSFDVIDVKVRLGGEEPHLALPVLNAAEYCFYIPEAGYYSVRGGCEIVVTPAMGAGAREVRLFLLGSAWSALSYQRGLLALHTSVVQTGDHAIAFCGATGSGKTSIAAWLVARGYRLVSDDLCRYDVNSQDRPIVYPSTSRIKIWRDALAALGWSPAGLERDHFRLDKFHWPVVRKERLHPLPVRAVYVLEWGELGISRLTGVRALHRLIESATYRGDLLEPMGQVAAHWDRCAELVRRVPVWEFTRPRHWAEMRASMALLTSHWAKVLTS